MWGAAFLVGVLWLLVGAVPPIARLPRSSAASAALVLLRSTWGRVVIAAAAAPSLEPLVLPLPFAGGQGSALRRLESAGAAVPLSSEFAPARERLAPVALSVLPLAPVQKRRAGPRLPARPVLARGTRRLLLRRVVAMVRPPPP